MGETARRAGRATVRMALAVGLTVFCSVFITVLLITAVGTVAILGIWLLPETLLLIRRIAGAKRSMAAAWSGREIPEAYQPVTGPLRDRLRTAVRDPGTVGDLRWMAANYAYGLLGLLALPLWLAGLPFDGVWCGLLRRQPAVLPLISGLADLDAAWSAALLKPGPKALLARRVEQLTQTRAGAIAAHSAELGRIERDLHDGAQARLVALSMRIGLAKRAYDRDPAAGRRFLEEAQSQADELDAGPRAPAAVDAAAYFVVAEALTNAAKHSGSPRAAVEVTRTRAGLRAAVRDEGLRAARAARAALPGLPVLVLSQYVEESYAAAPRSTPSPRASARFSS